MLKSSSSEKKLVKPLKNCFFGPNLHRKGVIMDHAQDEKKFFLVEITKADHQLSESFYFIKISYVLTELWIFFYLEWCFLSKKCHFQLKQMCGGKCYYKLGQLSYYNMGQTLLQIGVDLQTRATVITNWGMTRTYLKSDLS